tara:strand:+ start:3545 stop:3766 length:222 start_codon:yes stop_codon:yes gene_type:complete
MEEKLEEYRTYYVKGFISLLERDLIQLKQSNQFDYLKLLKRISEVTEVSQQQLRENVPKVIRVLIKGFKENLF